MYINQNRRFFLKKFLISFFLILFFFNKKNFFNLKKKNIKEIELIKTFYFCKKKYHKETVDLIFTNFLNYKNSFKNIIYNIEKRRKISNYTYKKNIKFLI